MIEHDEPTQWALDRLEEFIDMVQPHNLSSGNYITSRSGPKTSRPEVLDRIDVIEMILDRRLPEWRDRLSDWESKNYEFEGIRQAAIRCRTRIQRAAEVAEHLEPARPTLRTDRLHRWVWDAARHLWQDGHHQDAVSAAAEALDRQVCAKIDNRQRKGAKLYQNAYGTADPKPDEPRLRPPPDVDPASDTWRSLLEGARSFGAGAAMLIRNIATHERGTLTEQECVEALAALSLLARRVDADVVVRAERDGV